MQTISDLLEIAAEEMDSKYSCTDIILHLDEATGSKRWGLDFKGVTSGSLYHCTDCKEYYTTSIVKLALTASLRDELPVVIVSPQQYVLDITFQLISQAGLLPIEVLKAGHLEGGHWYKLCKAFELLTDAKIYLSSKEHNELIKEINTIENTYGQLGLIVIDDLSSMHCQM